MAKRGVGEHPKTIELAERLGIPVVFAVGVLELFWHWVAKQKPHGELTGIKASAIAHAIRYPGTGEELMNGLIGAGFVDVEGDRAWVHDWSEHADNAVHVYLKKRKECFADGRPPFQRNRARLDTDEERGCEPVANHSQTSRALRARTRPEPVPVPEPEPVPVPDKNVKPKAKEPRWSEIIDAFRLLLPEHLCQSSQVAAALRRFAEYAPQRQLRRWTNPTIIAKAQEVSTWTEAEIVASVDKCIRNNYGSLPPPEASRRGRKQTVEEIYQSLG